MTSPRPVFDGWAFRASLCATFILHAMPIVYAHALFMPWLTAIWLCVSQWEGPDGRFGILFLTVETAHHAWYLMQPNRVDSPASSLQEALLGGGKQDITEGCR